MALSFLGGNGALAREAAAAEDRRLQAMRAYWEGLRGPGGAIPARAALDPRGIAPMLDATFIAESIAPGAVRLRIAGMALADLAGMDMRGLPLSTLFTPEARLRLSAAVDAVFQRPAAVELMLDAERGTGRPALQGRLLLLPLLSMAGECCLMLGCLARHGPPGRAPRRFAVSRVLEEALVLPDPARAEPAPPPPPPRPTPGRGHLRLVHSA